MGEARSAGSARVVRPGWARRAFEAGWGTLIPTLRPLSRHLEQASSRRLSSQTHVPRLRQVGARTCKGMVGGGGGSGWTDAQPIGASSITVIILQACTLASAPGPRLGSMPGAAGHRGSRAHAGTPRGSILAPSGSSHPCSSRPAFSPLQRRLALQHVTAPRSRGAAKVLFGGQSSCSSAGGLAAAINRCDDRLLALGSSPPQRARQTLLLLGSH